VNDAGQITGYGVNAAGNRVGFLLSPVSAVPEPAAWALWMAGVAGLAGLRLRRPR
jgi:MYXO-CTERM domain-containing protein